MKNIGLQVLAFQKERNGSSGRRIFATVIFGI